ncbi:hypothetical protein [Glaciimonas immobilis]|uniref:Uncharacterized protein n=1 Tax=Glaciimonas immobilis TaxID=728004 RepID=A0A840RTU5_9BURK|nr:hypothetical protein [Glaciimonas immobilis]KAF3997045.1 hypothetical protein HAV38_15335 [Glaciimonas immobilis]MBB5199889.1 hypothetical protein [Glaciimonas immobilis]
MMLLSVAWEAQPDQRAAVVAELRFFWRIGQEGCPEFYVNGFSLILRNPFFKLDGKMI